MYLAYKDINFRGDSLEKIQLVNQIIEEFTRKGYNLTLRQVYYQMVARGYIPNNERSYKNLGSLINDGRLSGLISWKAIEDRTRNIRRRNHWDSPQEIIAACANQYSVDRWSDQPVYLEVWIEKDALIDIAEQACRKLDVPVFSCRGYVSQSEMWGAAQRFIENDHREERVIVHLGDHDPSGQDMTRDIQDRLEMFDARVEVRRIALNWDQIQKYNPPPNPTKLTDSRAEGYIAQFGHECWELDALHPDVLTRLIRETICEYLDADLYDARVDEEKQVREDLRLIADRYDEIIEQEREREEDE